jgi:hypothetical protein
MMMVLPEEDGPYSLDRSTWMLRMFPCTVISTELLWTPVGASGAFSPETCSPVLRFMVRVWEKGCSRFA